MDDVSSINGFLAKIEVLMDFLNNLISFNMENGSPLNLVSTRQPILKMAKFSEMFPKFLKRIPFLDSTTERTIFMLLRPLYDELDETLNELISTFDLLIVTQNGALAVDGHNFASFSENLVKLEKILSDIIVIEPLNASLTLEVCSDTIYHINLDDNETRALRKYITTAERCDLNSPEYIELKNTIDLVVRDLFSGNEQHYQPPRSAKPYLTIVGPSFMGKTQTAFNLARERPLFYVNFSNTNARQYIYRPFVNISSYFIACLAHDYAIFADMSVNVDTEDLLLKSDVKLKTIGLIWHFISISLDFDFNGPVSWFEFYLQEHNITFEPLNLLKFWEKMSKKYL